jgi:hypothetical protein
MTIEQREIVVEGWDINSRSRPMVWISSVDQMTSFELFKVTRKIGMKHIITVPKNEMIFVRIRHQECKQFEGVFAPRFKKIKAMMVPDLLTIDEVKNITHFIDSETVATNGQPLFGHVKRYK